MSNKTSATSAKRMSEILSEPVATGSSAFAPQGHDIVFEHVAFGYGASPDGRADEQGAPAELLAKNGEFVHIFPDFFTGAP